MKLYIITYNRPKALNETLENLDHTDFTGNTIIINNHPNFQIASKFAKRVHVLHNMVRPDCSMGNLSENYNQAIIHGFKSLQKPDTDIVVHIQDDCILHKNWCSYLKFLHKTYTFVVGKYGDNIVSYTPEAIKKIGLWDENFCGIQHKEADYWIRALIWNKEKSSINDVLHNRLLNSIIPHSQLLNNQLLNNQLLTNQTSYELDIAGERNFQYVLKRLQDDEKHRQIKARAVSADLILRTYFYYKWKNTWKSQPKAEGWLINWVKDFIDAPPKHPTNFKVFVKYPWFELDIENLREKNYLTTELNKM